MTKRCFSLFEITLLLAGWSSQFVQGLLCGAAGILRGRQVTSPNVSQRGRVATKRSSRRRRRQVKIRKLSCGPSSAVLLAVLAPGVPICGQWKDTPFPRLVVPRNWSRYFLPLSSAELQLATADAPGEIVPGKDSRSTATPRFCVP